MSYLNCYLLKSRFDLAVFMLPLSKRVQLNAESTDARIRWRLLSGKSTDLPDNNFGESIVSHHVVITFFTHCDDGSLAFICMGYRDGISFPVSLGDSLKDARYNRFCNWL